MFVLTFLRLVPVRDWAYLALALVIAAAGAMFIHHERALGAAKAEAQLQHERAEVAAAGASAAIAAQSETVRREAAMQEIVHANQEIIVRIAAAGAANNVDRSNFGVQLDAYVRARTAAANPAVAASGPTARDPLAVLADLLSRADARASELARIADDRGAAGAACEQSYDALK